MNAVMNVPPMPINDLVLSRDLDHNAMSALTGGAGSITIYKGTTRGPLFTQYLGYSQTPTGINKRYKQSFIQTKHYLKIVFQSRFNPV